MAHALALGVKHHQQPVALTHGNGNAVLQAGVVFIRHHQFVDYHFHVMVLVTVQLHAGQCLAHLAVHTDIEVAFLANLLEKFLVVSLTVAHQRGEDVNTLSFIIVQDKLEYLLFGIFHHFLAGKIRIGFAGTGIQQAKIIVYLRCRTHGGTRIFIGGLLFYGNHRAQTGNLIYIGTLQITQKITGISGKRFDIATLALGKYRIECEGRLAASAQPGDYRKAVAGNFRIDVFQVMYTRSVYIDIFCFFLHILMNEFVQK